MTGYHLLGIARIDQAREMLGSSRLMGGEPVMLVEALGLAALLIRPPKAAWFGLDSKRASLTRMVAFQKLLELCHARGDILPASFDTSIADQTEALGLLVAHARLLEEQLTAFAGTTQFQVIVRWDMKKAVAELDGDPAFVEMQRSTDGNRTAIGMGVARLMRTRKLAMRDDIANVLSSVSRDFLVLPLDDEDLVGNIVTLIDREQERALDEAVDAVDRMMPDALRVRYVGPLPPVSFASLKPFRPSGTSLGSAAALLGIDPAATPEAVREAYHARMRVLHPDAGGNDPEGDAARIAAAYKLMRRVAEVRAASGAASTKPPLLMDIRRDGDLRCAA